MAIHFLTPKVTCSLITGGSVCAGGGTLYWYQLPKTWKELFEKEGKVFLKQDNEYKGVYVDHKDDNSWKTDDTLKGISGESDAKNKIEKYCSSELSKPISSKDYSKQRKKLLSFCTIEGIVSVKGRLVHSGKSGWIEGDDADKKYKTVFAIYRYDTKFIEWLKKEGGDSSLNKNSKPSEKYTVLKNACTKNLKLSYQSASQNTFQYSFWFCTALEYGTIKERIQKLKSDWQEETTGSEIKKIWENTEQIKSRITTDQNKNTDSTLEDSDYSSWCSTHLNKDLSEDDSYQDKYVALMSACKKQASGS